MKFGPVPAESAAGAFLAHKLFTRDGRTLFNKGRRLSEADVAALHENGIESVVVAALSPTDLNENDKQLMKNLNVIVPPAMLFFKTDGVESKRERVIGFMKADEFLVRMRRAFAV